MKVSETTNQVGRISISTPFDMPYKEMALHCEALLVGKQQKMSTFMNTNSIQGYSFKIPPSIEYRQEKDGMPSSFNMQQALPSVLLYFIIQISDKHSRYFKKPLSSKHSHLFDAIVFKKLNLSCSHATFDAEWKSILGY